MTVFWIATIATTIAVVAFLVLPLTRKSKGVVQPKRADFDLTVYKDQLAEVDRDLERGVLNESQALAVRTEIERRMLAAAGEDDGTAPAATTSQSGRMSGALMVALLVVVPLGAFGMYYSLGNPGMGDRPFKDRAASKNQPVNTAERDAQLGAMIKDIETRLKKEPNNPRNLNVLGQAYEMLGDRDRAIGAYKRLVVASDRHPEALIVLAEALFADAGEIVTPDALALFKESKSKDPANPMTYYYLALERQQKGDPQGALDEFVGLLSVSPSNGPWVADIQKNMATLANELGVEVPVVKMLAPMDQAPTPAPSAPALNVPGPTAGQVQDAQSMSAEDQQAMIRSMVERLAGKLKDNPDDLTGWKRLAQAYRVLGDADGVAEAEAQIKRLSGQ